MLAYTVIGKSRAACFVAVLRHEHFRAAAARAAAPSNCQRTSTTKLAVLQRLPHQTTFQLPKWSDPGPMQSVTNVHRLVRPRSLPIRQLGGTPSRVRDVFHNHAAKAGRPSRAWPQTSDRRT